MVGEVTPLCALTARPLGSRLCTCRQSGPEGGPQLHAVWAGWWAVGATAEGTSLHALPCEAEEQGAPCPLGPNGLNDERSGSI